MITTIQLSSNTKMSLAKLKTRNETYEDVINRLMRNNSKELLKEGYEVISNESKKVNQEWSKTENWQ